MDKWVRSDFHLDKVTAPLCREAGALILARKLQVAQRQVGGGHFVSP